MRGDRVGESDIVVDDNGNPVLDQFSEHGFVDCTFRIAERSSDVEFHRLRLLAVQSNVLVGFWAHVRRGIRGCFGPEMQLIQDHVYRPAVEFVRSGPESDSLVAVLAKLYDLPPAGSPMIDRISFTGIALHQDDIDMDVQPIKIKLFGCDSDDEIERGEYFESYFNLDLVSGYVCWNEKDIDYRGPLVRGLSRAQNEPV